MEPENPTPANQSGSLPQEIAADAAAIWARANAPLADPAKFGQQVAEVYRAALELPEKIVMVSLPVREADAIDAMAWAALLRRREAGG